MKYVSQSNLAKFRKEYATARCSITGQPMDIPVVDHSHESGMIRGVVSDDGNKFEGAVRKAYEGLRVRHKALPLPDMLESLAGYLRRKETAFLHPKGCVDLYKRFSYKKVDEQIEILEGLRQVGYNVTTEEILDLPNSKERTKLFRKLIMSDRYE